MSTEVHRTYSSSLFPTVPPDVDQEASLITGENGKKPLQLHGFLPYCVCSHGQKYSRHRHVFPEDAFSSALRRCKGPVFPGRDVLTMFPLIPPGRQSSWKWFQSGSKRDDGVRYLKIYLLTKRVPSPGPFGPKTPALPCRRAFSPCSACFWAAFSMFP